MKQIELEYTNEVTMDLLESILKETYPDKPINRLNWGLNSPFLSMKMNYWLKEAVFVSQKPKAKKTKVVVNENCTFAGWFFLGWPLCCLFLKLHRKEVMNVIREALKERTCVVFLN